VSRVIVVAVHPDDETLGCGGTLLKHKANGDEIHWLIVTGMKENHGFDTRIIQAREQEINMVSALYGFGGVHNLGLPTMHLDDMPISRLVGKISDVFKRIMPEIIYLPFKNDVHTDHQIVFQAAYSCTKNFRHPSVKKVVMMETISETEFAPGFDGGGFVPNMFVDISDVMARKLEIMNVYSLEIGNHPFPRNEKNIRALATFRGATAGCEYAEGFMILKEIG